MMSTDIALYDNGQKIRDALPAYFSKYHFQDGGYNDKFFKIKLGPLFIPVPNTKARLDAVKIHDIHHLLTGYTAFWKGETEIGAWEIASGCGKYYMAWLLNLGSFIVGMFLFPRSVLTAFLHGRNAKTNLYHNTAYNEDLLNKTIGELRARVGINQPRPSQAADYLVFALWCFIGITIACTVLLAVVAGAIWLYNILTSHIS